VNIVNVFKSRWRRWRRGVAGGAVIMTHTTQSLYGSINVSISDGLVVKESHDHILNDEDVTDTPESLEDMYSRLAQLYVELDELERAMKPLIEMLNADGGKVGGYNETFSEELQKLCSDLSGLNRAMKKIYACIKRKKKKKSGDNESMN
jgi:hypothetical protein